MKESTLQIIKISLITSYLFLAIGLEQIYRNPLFTESLKWEKQWQDGSTSSMQSFFKVITDFGTEPVLIPLLIVIFLWFPLNKSFAYVNCLVYSVYFDNIMKMIYGNPRPYWVDPSLSIACDGGYGNPSGHSFSSMTAYLAFWHIITDFEFFKKSVLGIILRICLLILFLLLVFTIMLSRIFLGVHSVNQILYGASLGFAVYYIIFHIFSVHHIESKNFFNVFRKNSYILISSCWYAALLLIGFLIWGLINNDNSQWEPILTQKCPNIKLYRKFKNDGMFGFLTLFALIGAHVGLILISKISQVKFPNKEDEINHWYRGEWKCHIYRVLVTILFALPIILLFVIPGDLDLGIVYTFKVALPYLITVFDIYGPLIITCIILKIANKDIIAQTPIPNSDIESQVINNENGESLKRMENENKLEDKVQVNSYIITKS
jgi:membrane-associated phospholipid phosphatase